MERRDFFKVAGVGLAGIYAGLPKLARADEPPEVLYSTSPDRSNPLPLDGATVAGLIYVFVPSGYARVRFWKDAPFSDRPFNDDRTPPFDLIPGSTTTDPLPWDTTAESGGPHYIGASGKSGGAWYESLTGLDRKSTRLNSSH